MLSPIVYRGAQGNYCDVARILPVLFAIVTHISHALNSTTDGAINGFFDAHTHSHTCLRSGSAK